MSKGNLDMRYLDTTESYTSFIGCVVVEVCFFCFDCGLTSR